MSKKYSKTLIIILILLIISVSIGFSYATYTKGVNNDNNNSSLIETNEILSVNYLNGKTYEYNDFKTNDELTKKISITNVSDKNTFVTISLMDVEKTSEDITLKVLDDNNNEVYNEKITNVDTEIIKTKELEPNKTICYMFIIINNSNETIKSFSANLLTYTETAKTEIKNFKDTILSNNKVKDHAISNVGREISDQDEGLIKTTDELGDTYYFRGKVTNNYVNIGGFMFRILRINGDDTIRLITEDAIDEKIAYNTNSEETEDYKTKLLLDNATIKSKLDNWLTNNFKDDIKYIVKNNYCNDINVSYEENNVDYLTPYSRNFIDDSPTLVCSGQITKSNVGLITVDEATFAGAYQNKINNNFFLYNPTIENGIWTMSGSKIVKDNNSVSGIVLMSNGSLNYDRKISMEFNIRPVINIDKNTNVLGDGTKDNPYTIKK